VTNIQCAYNIHKRSTAQHHCATKTQKRNVNVPATPTNHSCY